MNGTHAVSAPVVALHAAILVTMVAALACEEKLHAKKSVIAGVAAVASLLAGAATGVLPHGSGHLPSYIALVDWGVIAVILGSGLFVDTATKSGIFTWLAIRLTKMTRGDPARLLTVYAVMTVLFSALLNNVTAMVVVGSLTVVSLRKLGQEKMLLGFLLCEGLLTNVGGLLTLISSVPNIIVGNTAGISFMRFLIVSAPFVTAATAATLLLSRRLFEVRPLASSEEKDRAAALISGFDENDGIESRSFFLLCWAVFGAFIVVLAATDLIPYVRDLGIGFVAMAFGVVMLLRVKSEADRTYAKIDWDLQFFFIFLFIVIGVCEHAQVLDLIGGGVIGMMRLGDTGGPLTLLWSSAAASSVTDNIPLSAVLAKTLARIAEPAPLAACSNYWWAVIYGANLGGNLTPIGSASTLVAVTIAHRNRLHLPFGVFVIKALPFALMQLVLASIYLLLLGMLN